MKRDTAPADAALQYRVSKWKQQQRVSGMIEYPPAVVHYQAFCSRARKLPLKIVTNWWNGLGRFQPAVPSTNSELRPSARELWSVDELASPVLQACCRQLQWAAPPNQQRAKFHLMLRVTNPPDALHSQRYICIGTPASSILPMRMVHATTNIHSPSVRYCQPCSNHRPSYMQPHRLQHFSIYQIVW
jgi:hypothetical protein